MSSFLYVCLKTTSNSYKHRLRIFFTIKSFSKHFSFFIEMNKATYPGICAFSAHVVKKSTLFYFIVIHLEIL